MKLHPKVLAAAASGTFIFFGLTSPALAGLQAIPRTAPTLDEAGLIGLGVAVGIVGLVTLIRRKK